MCVIHQERDNSRVLKTALEEKSNAQADKTQPLSIPAAAASSESTPMVLSTIRYGKVRYGMVLYSIHSRYSKYIMNSMYIVRTVCIVCTYARRYCVHG